MTKKVLTFVLAASFIIGGCSKKEIFDEIDDNENLVSGAFNGKITAQVENNAPDVNAVAAVYNLGFDSQDNFVGKIIGEGFAYSNNGFSLTLTTSGLNQYLENITEFFEGFMAEGEKEKIKISKPDAGIMEVDITGFYVDENEDVFVSGFFFNATSTQRETFCMFVYVDSDVRVTGGANISVSLKKGWNRLYKVSNKLTTQAPAGLKWFYEAL
jgi:hypothetical protein